MSLIHTHQAKELEKFWIYFFILNRITCKSVEF